MTFIGHLGYKVIHKIENTYIESSYLHLKLNKTNNGEEIKGKI